MTSEPKPQPNQQRSEPRNDLLLVAILRIADGDENVPVRVRNLSAGGMMVEGYPDLQQGVRVEADLSGIGKVAGTVAWTEAGRAGIAFARPINPDRALRAADAP